MIASALRAEMELFCVRVSRHAAYADSLPRCAATVRRLMRGAVLDDSQQAIPSVRALSVQADQAHVHHPALPSAYRAFAEYLATRFGVDDCRDAVEVALDSVDDLAGDPRDLSLLRHQLRSFGEHFEQFLQEATREPQRRAELSVTAA